MNGDYYWVIHGLCPLAYCCAFHAGFMDGLLGVAGMKTFMVMFHGSFPKIPDFWTWIKHD